MFLSRRTIRMLPHMSRTAIGEMTTSHANRVKKLHSVLS
uniref:Uncharacterized protein n=1 Tax=Arundo donax TaxID=35708 RepID=A0A0A9FKG9_ARUDO